MNIKKQFYVSTLLAAVIVPIGALFFEPFDESDVWGTDIQHQMDYLKQVQERAQEKLKRLEERQAQRKAVVPQIEISTTDKHIVVKLAPQVDITDKDVDLSITDQVLKGAITSKGGNKVDFRITDGYLTLTNSKEVKTESQEENKQSVSSYSFGSYSQVQSLPGDVDIASVKAEVKDNILLLTFTKKQKKTVKVAVG